MTLPCKRCGNPVTVDPDVVGVTCSHCVLALVEPPVKPEPAPRPKAVHAKRQHNPWYCRHCKQPQRKGFAVMVRFNGHHVPVCGRCSKALKDQRLRALAVHVARRYKVA